MGVDGYLTYNEAAEALGVQAQRVRQLVRRGQLDGVTVGGVPHVTPESVLERIESAPRAGGVGSRGPLEVPDGYVSSGDASKVLGVTASRVSALVADGMLDGMRVGGDGRYVVSREGLLSRILDGGRAAPPRKPREVGGYMKLTDAAKALGISKGRMSTLVKSMAVETVKEGKYTLVPTSEVERMRGARRGRGNPRFTAPREGEHLEAAPAGYIQVKEAAALLGVSRQRVHQLLESGRLEGGRYLDADGRALTYVSPETIESRRRGA